MDIKITCRACDRSLPLAMATDPENQPGHCPFCGQVLAFQYAGTFIDAGDRVMALGAEFVRQLTLLAELAGGFALEADSIETPVRNAIASQDKLVAQPYREPWPPRPNERVG